jgi:hypothetical protein
MKTTRISDISILIDKNLITLPGWAIEDDHGRTVAQVYGEKRKDELLKMLL